MPPNPERAPRLPVLPPGFVLGTVTSAWQVEGALDADGRGPSIWDSFAGAHGAVAAGHYERMDADVDLMRRLGAGGYRFSIAWPRVVPGGRGAVNQAGLDFYDRLVDRLCAADIKPMATLYHFDLPQALEDDGGWLNPATVEAYAEYASVVAHRLADRVASWVPVNAPVLAGLYGYGTGEHAPGRRLWLDSLAACHHLLLAHGRGVMALRAAGASDVGCANVHAPVWPVSDDAADIGASKLFDALWNGMALEPMLLGRVPTDLAPILEEVVEHGDLAVIRQPLDFYGVSYYTPLRIAAAPIDSRMPFVPVHALGRQTTSAGWPVAPDALREWLVVLRARFRAALPPIVVTECGGAFRDVPDAAGRVDDVERVDFLAGHLAAVEEACQRGVDVRGYYVWSLLDAVPWNRAEGESYGLVRVDPDTLERTPKASFDWLSSVVSVQPTGLG